MNDVRLTLVRHGQTEWSQNGRHTSTTDLALLPEGEARAAGLAPRLMAQSFSRRLVSPRRRARDTARLAGFSDTELEIDPDLVEWDYGEYEGLTSAEIRALAPDWDLWRDGCPGGESPQDVSDRVDRVIAEVTREAGEVILFAHGHILRALAARWLGQEVAFGERLVLAPATLSHLGTEHGLAALETWNASDG